MDTQTEQIIDAARADALHSPGGAILRQSAHPNRAVTVPFRLFLLNGRRAKPSSPLVWADCDASVDHCADFVPLYVQKARFDRVALPSHVPLSGAHEAHRAVQWHYQVSG